ncbi:MAG: hypothetical protein V4584_07120 [Verrucomicrobiota bacterium]
MAISLEFIKDRAVKTISAAKQVTDSWTWDEKTIVAMESQLAGIAGNREATPPVGGQESVTSTAEQLMLTARGSWDTALDQLHRWTMQGVSMAKSRFRNDPAKSSQLKGLEAGGRSRSATLDEALAWESAWISVDADWSPLPGLTLATFSTLRKEANESLKSAYSDARATWRDAAEKLGQLAADLEDSNQAWYADATRVFPAGTPEGDMIRGTIPTTYAPKAKDPAAPGETAPAPPTL